MVTYDIDLGIEGYKGPFICDPNQGLISATQRSLSKFERDNDFGVRFLWYHIYQR
jgi:hypothetical protein